MDASLSIDSNQTDEEEEMSWTTDGLDACKWDNHQQTRPGNRPIDVGGPEIKDRVPKWAFGIINEHQLTECDNVLDSKSPSTRI